MKKLKEDFPLSIKISLKKIFDKYRTLANAKGNGLNGRIAEVLAISDKYPKLSEGILAESEFEEYKEQIDFVLDDMFAPLLDQNEIKTATIPFQEFVFKSTQRYRDIINAAGEGYKLQLVEFDDQNSYIMACSIILNMYYGFKADFRRPFFYNIPNAQGDLRSYKVLFNADFIEIEKTDKAKEITDADYLELIENFDNIAIWKEKFPPGGYISKGFIIANMYDATIDVALSNFKANLLKHDSESGRKIEDFQCIIRSIFNLPDLKIGFTKFNAEDKLFEQMPFSAKMDSYILNGIDSEPSKIALCSASYMTLFDKHEFYCVSDIGHYHKLYPNNVLYEKLNTQKIGSAIIASLMSRGEMLGIFEIVSPNIKELNTVNANKLHDIMPFLIDAVRRFKDREESEIELLIQSECTSIHPSVHWKFRQEAQNVIKSKLKGESVAFREVVFQDVYPLYGQIDIKGSSEARNIATQKDLILQLEQVQKIIKRIFKIESLPIYEQIDFRITSYLDECNNAFQVDSERHILSFLKSEIIPLYKHLSEKSEILKDLIGEYYELVDEDKGFIYKHRKDYDDSVMLVNKRMASVLDSKQIDAQRMYPHYFERFKTDGVEHNLYIGESITKEKTYNRIYLYNLRLWQLQVMCEMERDFYNLKETLPVSLCVASMILVFGGSLSLRFRMDEKRFDVDGTYNARYEVVKKRVDKAHIKGTNERITQAGKIAIIYSQKEDEVEFLKYIEFLQSKKHLDNNVEVLELENLQGVAGLKALRVSVLYTKGRDTSKEYYTYEDLMDTIGS
jgi:hypothetical protein